MTKLKKTLEEHNEKIIQSQIHDGKLTKETIIKAELDRLEALILKLAEELDKLNLK